MFTTSFNILVRSVTLGPSIIKLLLKLVHPSSALSAVTSSDELKSIALFKAIQFLKAFLAVVTLFNAGRLKSVKREQPSNTLSISVN